MNGPLTRRDFIATGGAASLAVLLSSCGFGTGQSGSGGRDRVTIWDITTGDEQELVKRIAGRFSVDDVTVTPQFFQNDPYKNKLRTAMAAGEPPDIFYGWGGGILKSYVEADKVHELPSSVGTDRFFPSVLEGVTFDKAVYGIPKAGTQPVVFFYNKQLFDKHRIDPPRTWSELVDIVKLLKRKGVVPISLAGQNKWTSMMYLEYLVDRIGGPEAFDGVLSGKPGAWSNPAFIEANTMIQELVSMGAFPDGFTSYNADTGQDNQLLYSGKAAMHLMGAWGYADYLNDAREFVRSGKLGWFGFPSVEAGKGDESNVVGNLTNFYSISAASKNKRAAARYLDKAMTSDAQLDGLIEIGLVPPVDGIEKKLRRATDPDWLLYVYNLAKDAAHFELSWDQALSPNAAQDLLTNIDRVFLEKITPRQFAENMNESMGL